MQICRNVKIEVGYYDAGEDIFGQPWSMQHLALRDLELEKMLRKQASREEEKRRREFKP